MASKQLSIIVKAVDQASAPLAGITLAVDRVGAASASSGGKVRGALSTLASFAAGVGKTVAAGLAAVGGAAALTYAALGQTANQLDAINDASTRTGLAVRGLSELRYVAELSGRSFEDLVEGVSTAQKNLSQFARTGSGKAADAVKALNLNLKDSKGRLRDVNDLLPDLFDALSRVRDPSERVELTKRIFGDDRFLQFINEGGERLRVMREEARKLGVVFTPEQTQRAAEFRDSIDRVRFAFQGVRNVGLDALGDDLAAFTNRAASAVASIPEILGNAGTAFSKFARKDPQTLRNVAEVVDSTIELVSTSIRAGGIVVGASITSAVGIAFAYAKPYVLKQVIGLVADAYDALSTYLNVPGFQIFGFAESAKEAREAVALLDRFDLQRLIRASSEAADKGSALALAWEGVRATVPAAAERAAAAVDRLLGITDAIGKRAVGASSQIRAAGQEAADAADRAALSWENVRRGIDTGWNALITKAQDVQGTFERMTVAAVDGLAGGLASSIVDNVQRFDDLGDAARRVLGDIARQAAQTALHLAFLRVFTGVAFAAGGGGVGDAFGAGALVRPNAGGVVEGGRLRFDGGGIVPGYSRRDVYPALLSGGEGVLNTPAVARIGREAVGYANRGGTLVPREAAGNTVVNLSVSFTIAGGGGSGLDRGQAQQAGEVLARTVLDAIERTPALRERQRRIA